MGNPFSKFCEPSKDMQLAGLIGVGVGVTTTILVGAEWGVNYLGTAIFYGAVTGTIGGIVAYAWQNDFNFAEIGVKGVVGLFEGIVCGLFDEVDPNAK